MSAVASHHKHPVAPLRRIAGGHIHVCLFVLFLPDSSIVGDRNPA